MCALLHAAFLLLLLTALSKFLHHLDTHEHYHNQHIDHEVTYQQKCHNTTKIILTALLKTSLEEQHQTHESQHT